MQATTSCIDTPTAQPLLRPRCGISQLHGLSNPWRMGSAQHARGALQGVGMRANASSGVQQPRTSPPAATPRWPRLLSLASATSTAAPVSTSTTHQPTYDLFPISSSTMLGTSAPTVAPPAPPAGFGDPDSSAVNALTIGNSSSSSGREAWQRQGKLDLSFSTWLLYCNAYAASDQYQDRYRGEQRYPAGVCVCVVFPCYCCCLGAGIWKVQALLPPLLFSTVTHRSWNPLCACALCSHSWRPAAGGAGARPHPSSAGMAADRPHRHYHRRCQRHQHHQRHQRQQQ